MGSWAWIVILSVLALSACATIGTDPATPPEFHEAMIAFRQGDFERAERLFNQTIAKHIGSPFLSEAQWMQARSIEGRSDLRRALIQYRLFVKNYPTHEHRSEAALKISELEQNKLYPRRKNFEVNLAALLTLSERTSVAFLERWIEKLEKAGVDTIMVKVFRNGARPKPSGVFFQTTHAPVVVDGLTSLLNIAHHHHLRVFAWMSVRQMDWKLLSEPGWADLRYDPKKRALTPSEGMDLFRPDARNYITALYQDLARYPIDGIVFGDDLFYKVVEGLGPGARQHFTSDFGEVFLLKVLDHESLIDPASGLSSNGPPQINISNGIFWRWVGWKSRQAYHFLDHIKQVIKTTNPSLQFGILLSEEVIVDPVQALARYSQDLLEARRYSLDYYIISVDLFPDIRRPEQRTRDTRAHLSKVAAGALRLTGQPEKVLLRIHPREDLRDDPKDRTVGQSRLDQVLVPVAEFNPSAIHKLMAEAPEPLELMFRPRSPQ